MNIDGLVHIRLVALIAEVLASGGSIADELDAAEAVVDSLDLTDYGYADDGTRVFTIGAVHRDRMEV